MNCFRKFDQCDERCRTHAGIFHTMLLDALLYGSSGDNREIAERDRNSFLYTHKPSSLSSTVIEVIPHQWSLVTRTIGCFDQSNRLTTLRRMLRIILFSKFLFLKIFFYMAR